MQILIAANSVVVSWNDSVWNKSHSIDIIARALNFVSACLKKSCFQSSMAETMITVLHSWQWVQSNAVSTQCKYSGKHCSDIYHTKNVVIPVTSILHVTASYKFWKFDTFWWKAEVLDHSSKHWAMRECMFSSPIHFNLFDQEM